VVQFVLGRLSDSTPRGLGSSGGGTRQFFPLHNCDSQGEQFWLEEDRCYARTRPFCPGALYLPLSVGTSGSVAGGGAAGVDWQTGMPACGRQVCPTLLFSFFLVARTFLSAGSRGKADDDAPSFASLRTRRRFHRRYLKSRRVRGILRSFAFSGLLRMTARTGGAGAGNSG
jgi:hypothetical protein